MSKTTTTIPDTARQTTTKSSSIVLAQVLQHEINLTGQSVYLASSAAWPTQCGFGNRTERLFTLKMDQEFEDAAVWLFHAQRIQKRKGHKQSRINWPRMCP
jgi:hypothetical protein